MNSCTQLVLDWERGEQREPKLLSSPLRLIICVKSSCIEKLISFKKRKKRLKLINSDGKN